MVQTMCSSSGNSQKMTDSGQHPYNLPSTDWERGGVEWRLKSVNYKQILSDHVSLHQMV